MTLPPRISIPVYPKPPRGHDKPKDASGNDRPKDTSGNDKPKSSGGSYNDNPNGGRGRTNDNLRTRVTNVPTTQTNVVRATTVKPIGASTGIGMRATSMAPRQPFGGMGMSRGMMGGGGAPRMSFGRGFMR